MSNHNVSGEDEVCGEYGFIVKWSASEYIFNFKVSRIHGRSAEDNSIAELEDEVIKGDIKWDGCANIAYNNYMHYCTLQELHEQAEVLEWCYMKAKEIFSERNGGGI